MILTFLPDDEADVLARLPARRTYGSPGGHGRSASVTYFPTLAQLVERLTVEGSIHTGSHVRLSGGHRLKSGRSERFNTLFCVRRLVFM